VAALVVPQLFVACHGERDKPGATAPPVPTNTDAFDAGLSDGPPPLDAAGYCGNELHQTGYEPPNIYFVLDRSGSMATAVPPDAETRYSVVRSALLDLTRTLGPLINVGAALFPWGNIDQNPCSAGGQTFATKRGDPVTGQEGPTTQALRFATKVTPNGGTPIAATLEEIAPILLALPGRTVVLLATDGAPNCNADAVCGPEDCTPNIDGLCPAEEGNCCVAGGWAGPESCVDRQPTLSAVAALNAAGIDVYVIGIPGSTTYAGVLDQMADAGGTAQSGPPGYYRVDDLALVGQVFAEIAAQAIPCQFDLADPPDEQGMTNVYLDGVLVPYDPIDGWLWLDSDTVVLHGEACQRLKSGKATTVQVVTGCPTEYPT
jgi:hypothetical protein